MKFFIIIAFMAFTALNSTATADYPKEPEEEFNKIITECRKNNKMTDEEYTKLRLGQVTNPDENMQCMTNCFMENAGIMKDGKLQTEVATKIMDKKVGPEMAKKIIDTCGSVSGKGNCETAWKLHKCFLDNKAY